MINQDMTWVAILLQHYEQCHPENTWFEAQNKKHPNKNTE